MVYLLFPYVPEEDFRLHTQQGSQILNDWCRIVILNDELDVTDVYDVKGTNIFRRRRLEDVPLTHAYIRRKPTLVRCLGKTDVETSQLDCRWQALRYANEPNANRTRR